MKNDQQLLNLINAIRTLREKEEATRDAKNVVRMAFSEIDAPASELQAILQTIKVPQDIVRDMLQQRFREHKNEPTRAY